MTQWKLINDKMADELRDFANAKLSGRRFYRQAQLNGIGGEVRSLLRERGVDEARKLARKAIYRRNK